jgi:ribosomal protein S18 acetylase RimI-like enzyme
VPAPVVRPYAPADRAAVRRIAFDVGFMGEPADWYWGDFESFANIWTGYYTDHEPESAFVAEVDGRVVGFLVGCVDTRRAPSSEAAIRREVIRRVLFLRPGTARFMWRAVRDARRQPAPPTELHDPRWPSHLHINLLPGVRRASVGTQLVQAWFARLRAHGSPGCQLTTMAENGRAIAFFERNGFRRFGPPHLLPGMRLRSGDRMHLQVMVADLAAG